MSKSYSELMKLKTYRDRYNYLKIGGSVGEETFGGSRWLNQVLYTSPEWKRFRREIILRDNGCDLGCKDRPIATKVYIHHINPITPEDIKRELRMSSTQKMLFVAVMKCIKQYIMGTSHFYQ